MQFIGLDSNIKCDMLLYVTTNSYPIRIRTTGKLNCKFGQLNPCLNKQFKQFRVDLVILAQIRANGVHLLNFSLDI